MCPCTPSAGWPEISTVSTVTKKKNLKPLKKHPGALKCVRDFAKLIKELGGEGGPGGQFGQVEVQIWETLLRCDDRGRSCLKNEEKARRAKEKQRKKKEKKQEKKKMENHCKAKRKEHGRHKWKSGRWSDASANSNESTESSSRRARPRAVMLRCYLAVVMIT